MNYAFKIMSVVLALGVLVLQGCNIKRNNMYHSTLSDNNLCDLSTYGNGTYTQREHLNEIKRRGIDCGVRNNKTMD